MPGESVEDLIFGVEIEFMCHEDRFYPVNLYGLWKDLLPNLACNDNHDKGELRASFCFAYDSSVAKRANWPDEKTKIWRGHELVSPVFGIKDLGQFRDVCAFLQTIGARVSPTCGMHVHVGFKTAQSPLRYSTMWEHFLKIRDRTTWEERLTYCNPELPATEHHALIQHRSGSRYEVRCFNASLKFRAIQNAVWSCARQAVAPLYTRSGTLLSTG